MEIKLAKSAGFCFGVKRAVDMVNDEVEKGSSAIYTYGPIIHNEEVVKELEQKGVHVIPEGDELDKYSPGTVVIRSHGISRNTTEALENSGFHIVDATCPFVLKIHKIVEEHSGNGEAVVIVGNENHPEVQGIVGWIQGEDYLVISSKDEITKLEQFSDKKICIVSQTTFNYNKFKELVEIISQKGYDIIVLNTICTATEERQSEAAEIAKSVDAMLVVGGKSSSNTQKLFEICKKECEDTYYIQTKDDFDLSVLQSIGSVGITAGASTPNNIIEEVQKKCQK